MYIHNLGGNKMNLCDERQFELLKKIGFVRYGGTAEELQAAHILQETLSQVGVSSTLEPFKVSCYEVKKAQLEVLEPFKKTYTVLGVGLSGNTPEEGITAEFEYVEKAEPINLLHAKGKIVLINGGITPTVFENLIKAGVVGIINFSGTVIDEEEKTDIDMRTLKEEHLKFGKIPALTMRAKDAMEMVNLEAYKVRMTLEQIEGECDSHNLIAEIKGTDFPEEEVVFMAHYDSVPYSPGVYDNGGGSVIIMELVHYFLANPPKRTLKFIWFGSEERGLLGSKAYVEAHTEDLKNIKLGINVDMAGPILGEDRAFITADNSLCHAVDYLAKEIGFAITVEQNTYSSDCIPFADKGVPAISFARFGAPGGAPGHNRYDLIEHLSAKSLGRTMRFIQAFSEKLINAFVFPVPQEMPENMVEAVNKYLKKTPKKDK